MAKTFEQLWHFYFPNKVPARNLIYHYFKKSFIRFHSLPQSKRYAESVKEYNLLLTRQNQIITDCFGMDTSIFIVTTKHFYHINGHPLFNIQKSLQYNLIPTLAINLHLAVPDYYNDASDKDLFIMPFYVKTIWQPNIHNDLLTKIADDKTSALFISFEKNIIVAPYDGGIDFIIQDKYLKQHLKEKYKDWLPPQDND
ncbi:hypothetical protein [Acinetobacter sp. ANC 4648]|uniref:DUF3885 domain-containing protein n=1 Tax=Acinetobacter sp. ANC 4648 TaxID=1977875 RepID=UPI000A3330CD|nr:hypothetical protein [Acinetobacter sp. ANC 4648]OTG81607.1 hypothetical protein B9T27_10045 [Acinetobacter sp. ANC 4648]